jgi:polyketide synthase PksN
VSSDELDVDIELSEFGFDSIGLTTFSNYLNKTFTLDLNPTAFFEYPTIKSFSGYLVAEYASILTEKFALRGVGSDAIDQAGTLLRPEADERLAAGGGWPQRRLRRASSSGSMEKEPIGIVGMSGCFPGAEDVEEFWQNLKEGRDSIGEVPKWRWDWQKIYGDPRVEENKTNVKWGGFIEGVDEFDPLFFGISPKEAELMDPQQRLLMTHVWKALEDAGYSAQSLSGTRTGIFVGTDASGYQELITAAGVPIEGYSSTGIITSVGPNRMSYFLNLHGPSEPIQTACSSSLVAMHRAMRAIQGGDCEMALVGGINTIVTPWAHISFSKAGMLSEDGRCKTFSKEANGYVRGEGVGILFLKKLSAAERDGDHIYGLIKGTSENHGGRANSLTAPNPKAQAELIKAAYREAKVEPGTVTYIEAHGTGTPLGDPIEINGLKSAFADLYADGGAGESKEAHCGLGSVKTNIGHLELAAGVAGVIKVLLQFKHRTLVKSLHCEEINPYIQLEGSPFYIVQEARPWAARHDEEGTELPRRASVSSFGFGGVNAHVVLEEYRSPGRAQAISGVAVHPALIVLSAKSEERLKERARQLLEHIEARNYAEAELIDIAYTLQVGREPMEHRLAFVAQTVEQLKANLQAFLVGQTEGEGFYYAESKRSRELLSTLADDEDIQGVMRNWCAKGKYKKALELWVYGVPFDWRLLYSSEAIGKSPQPKRVRLPTYPFARTRYWVGNAAVIARTSSADIESRPFDADSVAALLQELKQQRLSVDEALERLPI